MRGEVLTETMEHFGIRLRLDDTFMSQRLIEAIRTKQYEAAEARGIRRFLQPGDTVLEIGAGIGFITALMLKNPAVERVVSFEVNPLLIPKIQRTLSDNGLGHQRFELHNAVLGREDTGTVGFHIHRDFWAYSLRKVDGTAKTC